MNCAQQVAHSYLPLIQGFSESQNRVPSGPKYALIRSASGQRRTCRGAIMVGTRERISSYGCGSLHIFIDAVTEKKDVQ